MTPFDYTLTTESLSARPAKVTHVHLGVPNARQAAAVATMFQTLPPVLFVNDMRAVVAAVTAARAADAPVVAAIGGHVIKTGCGPYLADLVRVGAITHLAMTGSAAVHDVELAIAGKTSEDVAAQLAVGRFGTAAETAELFDTAAEAYDNVGYGFALSAACVAKKHAGLSLLSACYNASVAPTVHPALGTDVVHMHPRVSWERIGALAEYDFRALVAVVRAMRDGVWLNFGSAVVMPEVFLKAVAVAKNLGADLSNLTTANFDKAEQYRTATNVLTRPAARGYHLTGHHELLIPLFHGLLTANVSGAHGTSFNNDDAAVAMAERLRARGLKVVVTNGCFDMLHAGHVEFLEGARKLGDVLFVLVDNDASVRTLKGSGRPIIQQSERVFQLERLACVDYVLPFHHSRLESLIHRLAPDVLVKGCDYANADVVGAAYAKEVVILPRGRFLTRTSTLIEQAIRSVPSQPRK